MGPRSSEKQLTFDPSDLDLSKNELLKGNSTVNLHLPTKFDGDWTKDLGGVEEQTDRQTDRQTDKRC